VGKNKRRKAESVSLTVAGSSVWQSSSRSKKVAQFSSFLRSTRKKALSSLFNPFFSRDSRKITFQQQQQQHCQKQQQLPRIVWPQQRKCFPSSSCGSCCFSNPSSSKERNTNRERSKRAKEVNQIKVMLKKRSLSSVLLYQLSQNYLQLSALPSRFII